MQPTDTSAPKRHNPGQIGIRSDEFEAPVHEVIFRRGQPTVDMGIEGFTHLDCIHSPVFLDGGD